jgi:hypothetical protein
VTHLVGGVLWTVAALLATWAVWRALGDLGAGLLWDLRLVAAGVAAALALTLAERLSGRGD